MTDQLSWEVNGGEDPSLRAFDDDFEYHVTTIHPLRRHGASAHRDRMYTAARGVRGEDLGTPYGDVLCVPSIFEAMSICEQWHRATSSAAEEDVPVTMAELVGNPEEDNDPVDQQTGHRWWGIR